MILHRFVFLFVVLLVTPTPGRAISIELGPRGSDVLIDLTDLEDAGIIIDTGRPRPDRHSDARSGPATPLKTDGCQATR
ncbi:MAG: hypothetical protein CME26_06150 [Gemmatimonadetes bacterium]|nr:hypothetical protein [Gemmatimonadota bacterium]